MNCMKSTLLTLNTALKVFVRGRRCAIVLKYSKNAFSFEEDNQHLIHKFHLWL